MENIIHDKIDLNEIVRREVKGYVGTSDVYTLHSLLDNANQRYAVVIIPHDQDERPSWVYVLARVEGDYVLIDEDGPADKLLHNALMVNGNIPREQIILAYKDESVPEKTMEMK